LEEKLKYTKLTHLRHHVSAGGLSQNLCIVKQIFVKHKMCWHDLQVNSIKFKQLCSHSLLILQRHGLVKLLWSTNVDRSPIHANGIVQGNLELGFYRSFDALQDSWKKFM